MIKCHTEILQEWNLSLEKRIASTPTSEVFLVKEIDTQERVVLKILNELGQKYEIQGAQALKEFQGIGAIKVLRKGESYFLLEYADGENLATIVDRGEDEKACEIITFLLSALHRKPEKEVYPNLSERFSSLFERGRESDKGDLFYDALKMAEELISFQHNKFLLHGDIHHENILHSSKRGWLSIDPQPLMGEGLYDFANLFFNPYSWPKEVVKKDVIKRRASIFARVYDEDPIRMIKWAFAHGALSMCWQLERGDTPTIRKEVSEVLRSLL